MVINHANEYDDGLGERKDEEDFKLKLDVSNSTLLTGAMDLVQKSNILTSSAKVLEIITRRIPSFDLIEFEKEVDVGK